MKIRFLYGLLSLCFIGLTVVLIIEKDVPCIIVSMPKIYSIYHSDPLETIDVELLTNQVDHYYFDAHYITNISIQNERLTFPVAVHSVQTKTTNYLYQDQEFQSVVFHLRPELTSVDMLVMMEEAQLVIIYDNGKTVSIAIGEFNYRFLEDIQPDISLNALSATYESINGIQSVGGLNISIRNRSDSLIQITSIDIIASGVITNESMLMKREACSYRSMVVECLYLDQYSFSVIPKSTTIHETIFSGQLWEGYVPLSYLTFPFLHEFAIEITYVVHQEEYSFIIDDFPYMKTANFQESYEEWYHVYYPDDSH